MVAVDLIPDNLKVNRLRRKHLRYWTFIIIICAGAGALFCAVKYLSYYRQQHNYRRLCEKYNDIQKNIQSLGHGENQLARYQGRIAVLNALNCYPDYNAIAAYLTENSPQLLYLREIEFSAPSNQSARKATPLPKSASMFQINNNPQNNTSSPPTAEPFHALITGTALDHKIVAEYLKILRRCPSFVSVKLNHTRRQMKKENNLIDFEIESSVVPGTLRP